MESLIATDWLKEYDPLFDLFDEEMRANQTTGCFNTNNHHLHHHHHVTDYECYDLNYNCNALGGYIGGFIGAGGAVGPGSTQEKHLQQQQQTDELALVLGLEWLPCPELSSPTSNGSSNVVTPSSSSAPSPTPASSAMTGTNSIVNSGSCLNTTSTTNSISNLKTTTQTSCFSSSALTPHSTSNHCNKLSSPSLVTPKMSSTKKVSTPQTNLSGSSASSVKAWKRRCIKQRGGGTSLLAHPSPVKSNSLHTNNHHYSNLSKLAVPLAQRYNIIKVEHAYAATLS